MGKSEKMMIYVNFSFLKEDDYVSWTSMNVPDKKDLRGNFADLIEAMVWCLKILEVKFLTTKIWARLTVIKSFKGEIL